MNYKQSSKVDLAIQIEDRKMETWSRIGQDEMLAIVDKKVPTIVEKIRKSENQLSAVLQDIVSDPDKTVEYYMLTQARANVDDMLNCDLRGLLESDETKRVNEYHRYTSIGSALLYKHNNYKGSSKFFSATWPNFKWRPYKFNDKASSAKAWGVNILFEHTWYRGRRLYLIGAPYIKIPNFSEKNFNDIASSYVLVT